MSLIEPARMSAKGGAQTLVVGDIQGCYEGLMRLLKKAEFEPTRDRLLAVGDLIARGNDSLSTIRFLMTLGSRFSTVLGNHDLHFLAVTEGIKKPKKSDKLKALLNDAHLPEIVDWLRQFPLAQRLDSGEVLVHAGLYPKWSTQQLLHFSEEVSQVLRGPYWQDLLANMYHSDPHHWSDSLRGYSRMRFIINATTRMRFLKLNQELEFAHKGTPDEGGVDLIPWYEIANPQLQPDETILFGHWAALAGKTNHPQFIGLDTGYVWGQTLTAYRLEDHRFIQVRAK